MASRRVPATGTRAPGAPVSVAVFALIVAAIKSRGTIGAIEFCSTNALTLTRTVQTAWSEPIALKRTSLRVRNPKNAPDAFERTVLRWFIEQKKARGKLPSHYLQLVTGAKAPRVRYYRPLVVQAICLSCHGPRSSMPDALRKRIAALYPADRAFDYKLNDFRGLVRVELSLGEAERR